MTQTSTFDKEAFLATHIEGEMETKFTPYPEDEYEGFIEDVVVDSINDSPVLQLTINLTDQKAKDFMKRDKATLQDTVFLDFTENGHLALGKNQNVRLGAYREAAGQNTSKAWSPSLLRGAGPMLFKLTHRYNKTTGEGPYSKVSRVVKLVGKR